VIQVKIN